MVAKSDPGGEDLVPHGPTCCNVSSKLSSPSLGHLAQAPWRVWVQTLLHRQIVCEHERGVGACQRLGEVDDRYPRSTLPYRTLERAPILSPPNTTVAGATNALSAIRGRCPSSAPKNGSCIAASDPASPGGASRRRRRRPRGSRSCRRSPGRGRWRRVFRRG